MTDAELTGIETKIRYEIPLTIVEVLKLIAEVKILRQELIGRAHRAHMLDGVTH